MPNPTPLTPDLIAAHERLHPRLASLLKQVERVASRRPTMEVPEESVRLGRELCREAARLLGREGRGIGMPRSVAGAPLDHASLAVQLGQALAGLELFETTHSGHSEKLGYAIWQIDGPPVPVTRLLPKGHGGKLAKTGDPEADLHRREVYKMIISRFKAGYDEGYKHAKEGKPPSASYAERAWDGLMEIEQRGDSGPRDPLPRFRYENPPRELVPKGAALSDPKERNRWP